MDHLELIIKEALGRNNYITFLTGAGISADSGIPTYRGTDGIWVKGTKYHKPEEFGTFRYFLKNSGEVWQYTLYRKKMFSESQPNKNHEALFEIEKVVGGKFKLITQNIDGLHQKAGNKEPIEIHGNIREVRCSAGCEGLLEYPKGVEVKDIDEDLRLEDILNLQCDKCGNWLRPNILWFDETYNEEYYKLNTAVEVSKNTGIIFILGTSGATTLPIHLADTVIKNDGYVVDINIEDNHFTEKFEHNKNFYKIREDSKVVLQKIEETIKTYYKNR